MGRRIAIIALAVVGLLLIFIAIGSYKGWFGGDSSIDGRGGDGRVVTTPSSTTNGGDGRGDGVGVHTSMNGSGRANDGRVNAADNSSDGTDDDASDEPDLFYAIAGFVTTVDGAAVPDVEIEIFEYSSTLFSHQALQFLENLGHPEVPLVTGNADGAGTFRLEVPGPGRYFLKARAPGHAAAVEGPIRIHRAEPVAVLSIPLPVGYAIEGFVLDGDNQPLGDIPVYLMQKGALGFSYYTHRAQSGPDGAFVFDGLEPTGYVLMVPPQVEGLDSNGTLIPTVTAPTAGLEVRVQSGKRFRGQVVELEGGRARPVSGASITVLNPVSYSQTTSDSDGWFEVFLNGTDANIVIECEGYLIHESTIYLQHGEDVFPLDRGQSLGGRIVYADGSPAASCEVGVLQASRFLGSLRETRTDSNGNFEVSGIDSDQPLYLLPRVPGYWIPFRQSFSLGERRDYVLEPTTSLVGVVEDEGGAPVDGAWLHLVPSGHEIEARAVYWLRGDVEGWGDESGEFVFDDVLPGASYTLRVSADGVADGALPIRGVPSDPVTVVLSPGATLDLTLTTEDGEPPEGAVLIASWRGAPPVVRRVDGVLEGGVRFLADSNGRVLVDPVPPGRATLYLICAGYVETRIEKDVLAGQLVQETVELPVAGELFVAAETESGDPVPMALVHVSLVQGSFSQRRRTGPLGVCAFSSLPRGRYRVSATGFVSQTVDVGAESVAIELQRN